MLFFFFFFFFLHFFSDIPKRAQKKTQMGQWGGKKIRGGAGRQDERKEWRFGLSTAVTATHMIVEEGWRAGDEGVGNGNVGSQQVELKPGTPLGTKVLLIVNRTF